MKSAPLRARFYVRYNDDFVILGNNRWKLEFYLKEIRMFVSKLSLEMPEDKTSIRKLKWGVDFLGFTVLKNGILIRNKTKQKIFERIDENNFQSYFATLKHCSSHNLTEKLVSALNDNYFLL